MFIDAIRRKMAVPKHWHMAQYRYRHPLINGNAWSESMNFETLHETYKYIAGRFKADPAHLEVMVCSPSGMPVGKLRRHCIQYLAGHLHLVATQGDQVAIECGQSLRRETTVKGWL